MQGAEHPPTSFLTLERRTPVVDRFGRQVGDIDRVMLLEGGGFDGIIVRTRAGARFVDAPEVRRIARGAVVLASRPPMSSILLRTPSASTVYRRLDMAPPS